MDGLTWLIISWLFVGVCCYLMLTKLSVPHADVTNEAQSITTPIISSSSSEKNANEQPGEWLNETIEWLFKNMHHAPDTLQAWIASMNDAAKKISSPDKCEVLFEGFSDNMNTKKVPRINSIRLQQTPNDHLIVRCTISVPEISLKLVSSQQTDDRLLVTNYDAKIIDLHGEVEARMACIGNQIYLMACFCGRPELDIELMNKDFNATRAVSGTLVDEIIRKCLLTAVINVSLTESRDQRVFSSFPHGMVTNAKVPDTIDNCGNSATIPVQQMMKRMNQSAQLANQIPQCQGMPNKVRVKVIRAQRLGGDRSMKFSSKCIQIRTVRPYIPSVTTKGCQIHKCFALSHCDGASACSSWHALALFHQIDNTKKRRLQEKTVISGAVNQPYVVVEMDEPAQKFQTSCGLNMSPYWEESFDFELTSASEEILFEIYEGTNDIGVHSAHNALEDDRFLGLAIVGLKEVRRSNTASSHTLKLQGRPYRNDAITGNLTVQFDFYYDPVMTTVSKYMDQTAIRNNFDQLRENTSSTKRPIYDPRDSFSVYDSQEPVATATTVITKNVSQQLPSGTPQSLVATSGIPVQQPSTTTIGHLQPLQKQKDEYTSGSAVHYDAKVYSQHGQPIVNSDTARHSTGLSNQPQKQYTTSNTIITTTATSVVQQQPNSATNVRQQYAKPGSSVTGQDVDNTIQRSLGELRTEQIIENDNYLHQRCEQQPIQKETTIVTSIKKNSEGENDEMRQSRDRVKKQDGEKSVGKRDRSFFSELRYRLSGHRSSKRRAKSCDLGTGELEEAVSLPPSRDPSRTRYSEKQGIKSNDSASYGGKSERSTKSLYQHSTLLLEVCEKNGQLRYYLIPPTVLDEPPAMKLLRQGKKLHIYNDHTFVAVKSPSGTVCNVCRNRIGRSNFSKQAYQCRDCRLVCHKPCHYKAESYCTSSNVNKLNITKDVDWEHFLTSYQVNEFISEDGI